MPKSLTLILVVDDNQLAVLLAALDCGASRAVSARSGKHRETVERCAGSVLLDIRRQIADAERSSNPFSEQKRTTVVHHLPKAA